MPERADSRKNGTRLRSFLGHEGGAVTTDYVVMLSMVAGLGFAVVGGIGVSVTSVGSDTAEEIASIEVDAYGLSGEGDGDADGVGGGAGDGTDGGGDTDDTDDTGETGGDSDDDVDEGTDRDRGQKKGHGPNKRGGQHGGGAGDHIGNPGNDKTVGRAGENPGANGRLGHSIRGRGD